MAATWLLVRANCAWGRRLARDVAGCRRSKLLILVHLWRVAAVRSGLARVWARRVGTTRCQLVLLDVRFAFATAVVRRSEAVIRSSSLADRIAWLDDRLASIAKQCDAGHPSSLWALVRELSGRRRGSRGAAVLSTPDGVVLSCREEVREAWEQRFFAEFSLNGIVAT